MSKTDKTRPYWVQLTDRVKNVQYHVQHRCASRDCNEAIWMPRPRQTPALTPRSIYDFCHVWPRYQDNDKIFGRRPRGSQRRAYSRDGVARADLRRLRHKWLTTADAQDIDSRENLPSNRWLWRGFYWD